MKKGRTKDQQNQNSQLDMFQAATPSQATPGATEPQTSKVISLADHNHQQDIKKYYDQVNKLTSHLK